MNTLYQRARYAAYKRFRAQGFDATRAYAEMQGECIWSRLNASRRPHRKDFKSGKGIYPLPVYVARLRGGRTIRVSFWTREGKPIDAAAGFNLAMTLGRGIPQFGYIEHNGQRIEDEFFSHRELISLKTRRRTVSDYRATLAEVSELIRAGNIDAALAACAA